MDDQGLDEIRARRLAELQRGNAGYNGEDQKAMEEKKKKAEEMRHNILSQVLDQDARARLNTLMVAKPEKGQIVENILLQMAQRGQIMGKMGEDQLKDLLEKVSEQTQKQTKVKFDRRRAAMDSDDDLELDV